jgi:hypothetical protein
LWYEGLGARDWGLEPIHKFPPESLNWVRSDRKLRCNVGLMESIAQQLTIVFDADDYDVDLK